MNKDKTIIIVTHDRDVVNSNSVCGLCFAMVEIGDSFCWSCGAEFESDRFAMSYEELEEFNDERTKRF